MRARLTEIHVGFPQTQSLRLDRDAGKPTRPRPVAVISPDIASLSQKLSEHSRAAAITEEFALKSGNCTETCEEMFTRLCFTLEFPQRPEIKQRDVSARKVKHSVQRIVLATVAELFKGGMMGNLNTLPYLVNGSLRTLSKCLSAGPPTCHPSIHLTIDPSIIYHPSTCTSPASTLRQLSRVRLCAVCFFQQSESLTHPQIYLSIYQKYFL